MSGLPRTIALLLAVAFSCVTLTTRALSQSPAPAPAHLVVAGSGANLGITRLLAEAFMKDHPHITVEVPGSIGSRGALKAAAEGAISLGLISKRLTDEEKNSLGLMELPYARVAIVVAAHPSVPDEEITSAELVDIFKGTKPRWKDGREIVALDREKSDSGFMVLQREIPGFREACEESRQAKRWPVFYTDQDANRALSTIPYAIGVTDMGMINTERLNVKVLKFNGVLPSTGDILSGKYPLVRFLSFIYPKGKLSEEAEVFVEFVRSEKGAGVLRTNGFVPAD